MVSSKMHEKGEINFDDLMLRNRIEESKAGKNKRRHLLSGYNNSKLMNVYYMRGLADRLKGTGIDVSACCPGFCYTGIFRHSVRWYHYIFMVPIVFLFMKSAKQGAETVIHAASDYSIEGRTCRFYRNCEEYESKYPFDKEVENKLWEVTEQMIKARKPIPAS